LARDDKTSSPVLNPIYIVGFVLVGVALLGLLVWLAIRTHRRRAVSKREENRGAAFLSVRGLVKNGEPEKSSQSGIAPRRHDMLSRDRINCPSVVLPAKTLTRPTPQSPSLHQDVMEHHRQSDTFPKPFSFALAVGTGSPRSPPCSPNSPGRTSVARSSISSRNSRYSVRSSTSSVGSGPTTGTTRKVRQLFTPILPDELVLRHVGDQLTVINSFDDGWCLVGRENGFITSRLFKSTPPSSPQGNNVELGVVPAWCFIKPTLGLRAERPVRASSLGITVQVEAPGNASRNEVISWSNF